MLAEVDTVTMANSVPTLKGVAERARFENSDAPETIGPDLISSLRSQSITVESEAGEKPIKPDRTR